MRTRKFWTILLFKDYMCTVNLSHVLMASPQLTDAGENLFLTLSEAYNSSERVVIDMTGVTALPSIFLNVSLGRAIDCYGMEWLKQNVSFSKITKTQAGRISEYLTKYNPR